MAERVTVTLPGDLVRDMDRLETNRSRFVQDAVRRELERRRRELLQQSLSNPHPNAADVADAGLEEWAASLPDEDAAGLVDVKAGTEVRWAPGAGWSRVRK